MAFPSGLSDLRAMMSIKTVALLSLMVHLTILTSEQGQSSAMLGRRKS